VRGRWLGFSVGGLGGPLFGLLVGYRLIRNYLREDIYDSLAGAAVWAWFPYG
jgi:hypothetical protein